MRTRMTDKKHQTTNGDDYPRVTCVTDFISELFVHFLQTFFRNFSAYFLNEENLLFFIVKAVIERNCAILYFFHSFCETTVFAEMPHVNIHNTQLSPLSAHICQLANFKFYTF